MLDTSAKTMWDELEASRRQIEKEDHYRAEAVARYHGPFYDSGSPTGAEPENAAFEYIATKTSQIMAGNPACSLKPTRGDRPEVFLKAKALQHAMNRCSREGNDRATFKKLLIDWHFGPCLAYTSRKPMPWIDRGPLDGPAHRPTLRRVRPEMRRRDARATDWEETRWRGHGSITSKGSLLELAKTEPGWRIEELGALKTETGFDKLLPMEGKNLQGRDDVKVWMVWVPEEQLDPIFTYEEGFWGTTHWYAETESSSGQSHPLVEIRDPQPYFGCRTGPYHMSGQFYVPDRIHPLSVMAAIESIAKMLRLQSSVIDDGIRNFSRFIINGTAQKGMGRIIKNAKHNGVVDAKGFQRAMVEEFTKGGIDNNMIAGYEYLQNQMRSRIGLSSTEKGNPQSGTTATAETFAAQGGSARDSALRDEFYAFIGGTFRARAEMIDQDDQFFMPPPPELAGQIPGIFGGREPGETFDDYELDVQPISMRWRSEEEKAAAADYEVSLFGQIAPMAVQYPFLDIPGILDDVAEARGDMQIPSRFNSELAAGIAAMMLGQAALPGAMAPGTVRPSASMGQDSPAGRSMLQPPAPMASLSSAGGAQGSPQARPAAPGSGANQRRPSAARSQGAAQGNKARKASYANQGGRPS